MLRESIECLLLSSLVPSLSCSFSSFSCHYVALSGYILVVSNLSFVCPCVTPSLDIHMFPLLHLFYKLILYYLLKDTTVWAMLRSLYVRHSILFRICCSVLPSFHSSNSQSHRSFVHPVLRPCVFWFACATVIFVPLFICCSFSPFLGF